MSKEPKPFLHRWSVVVALVAAMVVAAASLYKVAGNQSDPKDSSSISGNENCGNVVVSGSGTTEIISEVNCGEQDSE